MSYEISTLVCEIGEVRTSPENHRSLHSRSSFRENQIITEFTWEKEVSTPNYLTVQVGENKHIELMPQYLECINHSCDPNCFFDVTKKQLIALKSIEEGEEFTFFYPSTEWSMDRSFHCFCGTGICLGHIQGAKYLTPEAASRYRFSEFIQQKLKAVTPR